MMLWLNLIPADRFLAPELDLRLQGFGSPVAELIENLDDASGSEYPAEPASDDLDHHGRAHRRPDEKECK